MKKYRLSHLMLSLALTAGLLSPTALADAPSETPSPVPSPTATSAPVESQLLKEMNLEAASAILIDADTGTVLYDQDSHTKRFPASITKVMTATLAIEAIESGKLSRDQIITAGPEIDHEVGSGSSTQNIKEGEQMRLEDILYCALTASANEACNFLAQAVSGNIPDFVDLMNQRAQELGMKDTHFSNTHGYHNEDHYTTAYDISLLSRQAMTYPLFQEIVSSKSHTVPATNLHEARELHDTNALVSTWRITGYFYQYATGIKTGHTPEAGYCLASSATKGDSNLIAVVMGCEREPGTTGSNGFTYFKESKRLLEWGFSSFSAKKILDSTYFAGTIPVTLSRDANYVGAQATGELEAILPNDLDPANFQITPEFNTESLEAPVTKGDVLGHVTVSNGDTVYGTLDLVAVDDISRSELLYRLDRIEKFFSQLWVKIALGAIGLLIAVFLLRWLIFGRSRRYGGGRRGGYSGRHYGGRRRR